MRERETQRKQSNEFGSGYNLETKLHHVYLKKNLSDDETLGAITFSEEATKTLNQFTTTVVSNWELSNPSEALPTPYRLLTTMSE